MKVTVNPGRVVDDGKNTHKPGDLFECDEKEGKRLIEREIVSLHEEENKPVDQELIVVAIGQLDSDKKNTKDWTKSGVPQTAALETILGEGSTVSAKERDEAYAVFLKNNQPQE